MPDRQPYQPYAAAQKATGIGPDSLHPMEAGVPRTSSLWPMIGRVFENPAIAEKLRLIAFPGEGATARFAGATTGKAYETAASDASQLISRGKLLPEAGPYEGLTLEQLVRKLTNMVK